MVSYALRIVHVPPPTVVERIILYMIASLLNITVISEWCAFISAIFFLRKRTTSWQFFILVLFLTICVETTGWYLAYFSSGGNNWIFNILLLINDCFSIWLFSKAEPMRKIRKPLYLLIVCFIVFAICNLMFIEGTQKYNGYTEVLGDIMQATISCWFFYEVLREEKFRDLFRYEYFWLANGLLFCSLGSVVLYIFPDYLYAFYLNTKINVYGYINYLLNILLYGSLIIAFICRSRNTKSSPA
jgi:hypothetical protein